MKISEAFDLYKNNYMLVRGFSRRVIETHDRVKGRLVAIVGDKELSEFSLEDIGRYAAETRIWRRPDGAIAEKAPSSIKSEMTRIRGVLKYMNRAGEECINYLMVPIPKVPEVERCFLTADEVQAMIDCAYSIKNQFIIALLYSSGIRVSEFLSLDRDSIVGRNLNVVGKGGKSRLCFVDERTVALMEEYLATRCDDDSALVVSDIYKTRMTKGTVELIIKNSAKRAGIQKQVTPHVLRHSFATNFIKNNGNIRYLSRMLGHSNINTTMVYTHIVDNDLLEQYDKFHSI